MRVRLGSTKVLIFIILSAIYFYPSFAHSDEAKGGTVQLNNSGFGRYNAMGIYIPPGANIQTGKIPEQKNEGKKHNGKNGKGKKHNGKNKEGKNHNGNGNGNGKTGNNGTNGTNTIPIFHIIQMRSIWGGS